MTSHDKTRYLIAPLSVLCGTGMLLGTPAYAQETECVQLDTLIVAAGNAELREEFRDVQTVVTADDAAECRVTLERVAAAGGLRADGADENSADAQEVQSLDSTVQVQQQATIEGQVNVTLPDPEVSIDQDQAEVSITRTAPDVTVSQGQPTIEVRQAQPIITVTMAQPSITVEQPAPEITITMPDPTVNVANAQPQVSVMIPEPRVTVRQGEPSLDVDLNANTSDTASTNPSTVGSFERMDDQGIMTVTATGEAMDENSANVNFIEPETTANITYEGVEPVVSYVAAEPQVVMESDGEPTIDVVQSGDPKIMIKQASDDDTASAQGAVGAHSADNPWDPSEAFAPDENRVLDGTTGTLSIADIEGMDVINARDEELGTVDRVVRNGNDHYVVIAHGGWFFGLNDKEVAFPVDDVLVSEGQLLLRGLSEEQIEAMPDYDYANEVQLASEDNVELTIIAE